MESGPMKVRQVLMHVAWIVAAEPAVQDALVKASRLVGLRKGEELVRRGQLVSNLAIVGSGAIEIRRESRNGERHVISVLYRGQTLGYNAIFMAEPATTIDMALDASDVVLVPRDALIEAMQRSQTVLLGVLAEMARRSDHLTQLVADPYLLSPMARVARTLLNLANWYGPAMARPETPTQIRFSQKTLGGLLGMPRQRINGELKRLEGLGLISLRYSVIALLDKVGLEAIVENEI